MNVKFKESVSSELRKLRADVKLTLEEIALKSGVNKDTISRYENNTVSKNLDVIFKLLIAYNVELNIFFANVNANMQNNKM